MLFNIRDFAVLLTKCFCPTFFSEWFLEIMMSVLRFHMRKKTIWMATIFLLFLIFLHLVLKFESMTEHSFAKLDIDIPINFVPVRITEREELPASGNLKIPKRIHQTWKGTKIPHQFARWVKTWIQHHPDWEYWLWTDESARKLISERHPSLLSTFDEYDLPVKKADALRYVVLYEFGGIYADMDMEALTSLEPLALKYSCFVGQEPYEHPILDSNFQGLVINALMGCEPHHPFIKSLIDNLPAYSTMWHVLDSTGPHYMTVLYRQYYQGSQSDQNSVYITPSEYFYPTMDPSKIIYFYHKCNYAKKLSKLQKNACRNLKYRNLPQNVFDIKKIAFTNHHWSHTYVAVGFHQSSEVDIDEVVSNVNMYQ